MFLNKNKSTRKSTSLGMALALGAATLTGAAGITAATNYGVQPASAQTVNLSNASVGRQSATCITAYDHIDQYGRPYGARQTRCAGQSFSHSVDWDMFCWPYGYRLAYLTAGNRTVKYDNTSDHCMKVRTLTTIVMWSKKN